ncbi:hypothetical protein GJ697_12680 [Pseudoduganella sp. FT25W]|uniref:Uncharacterized protein n=1 Tax=Duganella alba TaxID=2666081 RepID=A0A6L5QG98_9BURK|nr:hypothetical protein [Duganella alba]MRX08695.1 hypothetical protein [Duganella alba]MRX18257.1 hypothetical protein [Duganella alba]
MIGLRRVALLSSILPMANRPDSKLIGQITATLNGCAPLKLPEECAPPASWNLELRNGRRPRKPQPQLPKTGYVPTRGKDGAHVGLFYPKGC